MTSSLKLFQLFRQRVCPLGDVAGPEANHEVARLGQFLDKRRQLFRALDRPNVPVTAGLHARDEIGMCRSLDRLLPRGVDRSMITASASLKQFEKSSNRLCRRE